MADCFSGVRGVHYSLAGYDPAYRRPAQSVAPLGAGHQGGSSALHREHHRRRHHRVFLARAAGRCRFSGANAAFGTFDQAPDFSTAFRQISFGSIITIIALVLTTIVLVIGATLARYVLLFLVVFGLVLWMLASSAGDQWPAIALFGLISYGAPAIFLLIVRRLF